ncbi:MAG: hypothetical protein HKN68_11595, partial [Saprospiraceae bacterium]|nr:hypothetical protein [Saprospiraceae bacterium]
MKNIFYTLILIFFLAFNINGQELRFSFSVTEIAPGVSEATVFVERPSGGSENITSFNYGFHFNSDQTNILGFSHGQTSGGFTPSQVNNSIDASGLTGLGWAPELTGAIIDVPFGAYDRLFIGSAADANAIPFTQGGTDVSTKVPIIKVKFDNTIVPPPARVSSPDAVIFMGGTDTPGAGAWRYADFFFNENPIVVDPTSQREQALPIVLKSFTAQAYSENSVLLDWTSSIEINSSHFDIERSEDGLSWEKVGEVQAAGNSDIERDYSFIDRNIQLRRNSTKVFYYRLNMIDQDASQEYSEVKAVRLTHEGYADVTVFPNPTAELLNIDVSSDLEDGNIKYEITDIKGRRLITESID